MSRHTTTNLYTDPSRQTQKLPPILSFRQRNETINWGETLPQTNRLQLENGGAMDSYKRVDYKGDLGEMTISST